MKGTPSNAACKISGGCNFAFSLGLTPVMVSSEPSTGNEGGILNLTGHGLAPLPYDNIVSVGGQLCPVFSATSEPYTVPMCNAISCTQELRTLTRLLCTLPYHNSFAPHQISVGVLGNGTSPTLSGATITYAPLLRYTFPRMGSVAGGTRMMLVGDGLSNRVGDIDVTLAGVPCRVFSANYSHAYCITGAHSTTNADTTGDVVLSVRGNAATCAYGDCTWKYSKSLTTSVVTSATVLSSNATEWEIELDGSKFLWHEAIFIGSTPCILFYKSGTQLRCKCEPPLSGEQVVTMSNNYGNVLGDPSLPTITGTQLTTSDISPYNVSLAGGAELTISGAGFSATETKVSVCGKACAVTSVASLALKCTAPSLLLHATGIHTLNLTNATEAELDLGYTSPPPPPPGITAIAVPATSITVQQGKVVALRFTQGFNDSSLPRGSEMAHAALSVTPHSGASGAVVLDVRASLYCGSSDGPEPTDTSQLWLYNQTSARVEWDIQPYDLGFATDESPDLSGLIKEAISNATTLDGCSIVLILSGNDGPGVRTFYSSAQANSAPELRIRYEPPTTAAQLAWTDDQFCQVDVSVPTAVLAGSSCGAPSDSAASKLLADTNSCPHLHVEATAATSADTCDLSVNGLSLMSANGCGLDRLVDGRDGVCVALIDPPNKPRAACFDTKTAGKGAEQLASWIDVAPQGATVAIASCSRLSWAHNRPQLATALAKIGAGSTPTSIDDAYAVVGIKGGAALSESRTQCCLNPNPVCGTCDQTVAKATADVSCGIEIGSTSSALSSATFVGSWASNSMLDAVASVTHSAAGVASSGAVNIASLSGVISALQAEDVDELDFACDTAISDGNSIKHGAQLATDGDATSYWLSVGRPDALLTLDLGASRLVQSLTFNWKYPAKSLLVMYSTASAGSTWEIGGSISGASDSGPAALAITTASSGASGAVARRLRLYMSDHVAYNASWPLFAINELTVQSCPLPMANSTLPMALGYALNQTMLVTAITPTRGSTAGGTSITLTVDGLGEEISAADVTVTVVGVACAVNSVKAGQVVCTTGSYGVTSRYNLGNGPVSLTIAGRGTAASTGVSNYEYVDLWSRVTTWGGSGPIPGMETLGDSIWIQQGQRILLDGDVRVYMLIVQGTLEFDRKDVKLDANYIFIMGSPSEHAYFIVGTEKEPFLQTAIITLHGSPVSKEIPVYGAKTLSCRFCTLDLHGRPLLDDRTHVKLAKTAKAGDTEIFLMERVDWDVDAHFAITSTAANGTMEEAETQGVVAVLDGGYRIQLTAPLLYDHLGEVKYLAGGHSVEFRANAGILSRNVVIQGDPMSQLDKHGAHIMLHSKTHMGIADRSKGESLRARLENFEIRYCGQMGRLGRYAIHFHMIGAVRNSYVRYTSIHHSYQRAIAIHGVHYLRIVGNGTRRLKPADNAHSLGRARTPHLVSYHPTFTCLPLLPHHAVAFETKGHTYFVEDGLETKNVITGNLGANTRELFVGITSDATPATYWLVNGDNYVERNIAAGSTHYGFWFFPEPKVRGASEFEPGSDKICPQGTPLYHFADNEGHNNGRYGLRIFTGLSPHNGEGLPGFYPKSVDSCAPVSATNQFKIARFYRQFSWRNHKNGITVGSVAAVQLIDPIIADNNMRGIEMTGADGVTVGLETLTKLRGPWGMNKLIRPLFVGHDQPCPNCDHTYKPNMPHKTVGGGDGHPMGWVNDWGSPIHVRLGLVQAAWLGLTVEDPTFINYDREGMIAVGGFAKALPPGAAGYDFKHGGAMETRFSGVKWFESNYRVRWRWTDEALFHDLDGTFCEQSFCAGCHVLQNTLVNNKHAFPDCYQDWRYGGTVCKPPYKFVQIGFTVPNPLMIITTLRLAHRDTNGLFVRSDDATYLRNKWRPAGGHNFITMDVSTDILSPKMIGEMDPDWFGGWLQAEGMWIGPRVALFNFTYAGLFDGEKRWRQQNATFSEDGTIITWSDVTSTINGSVWTPDVDYVSPVQFDSRELGTQVRQIWAAQAQPDSSAVFPIVEQNVPPSFFRCPGTAANCCQASAPTAMCGIQIVRRMIPC